MDFSTRYDFLKTAVARYDAYFNLLAVKASLLLTSNAIFLAPAAGQRSEFLTALQAGGAPRALLVAATLLSLASLALASLVMASWLGRPHRALSLMFSDNVAAMTPAAYVDEISRLDEQQALTDLAQLAHLLATGITRKFRYVNLSLAALVLAVGCAFLALIV
jgi:HAMP domain-containing protein